MPVQSTWVLSLLAFAGAAQAVLPDGEKAIRLLDASGAETVVGTIVFHAQGDTASYDIDWNLDHFGDYFLSMRPFKCLEGTEKLWCRVPYPYDIKRTISADDLTDLEYDTLFIWKKASDYGINMWNGVYYRFELTESGLVGTLNEMDMDILSAPPEAGDLRPVGEYDIEPGDPDSHWLPTLRIE